MDENDFDKVKVDELYIKIEKQIVSALRDLETYLT